MPNSAVKPLILVDEDDPAVRNLIVAALEAHGLRHMAVETAHAAIAAASSQAPSIVLLDLGLPDMDGVKVVESVRAWSGMPIIVVSARSEDADKLIGFESGADDYITKPFNILELKARIRALIRRSSMAPAAPAEPDSGKLVRGHIEIDPERRSAHRFGQNVELTLKEFDLIELLMRNPGKVYSREQLLDLVWGYDYQGDIRTVDVHIRRLREKLERNPAAPEYIITKWGVGYYFAEA